MDSDVSDTYINDILWMERDMIAEWCGFSSWEALENGEEEDLFLLLKKKMLMQLLSILTKKQLILRQMFTKSLEFQI